jgi:hypothetical protein
VGQFVSLSPSIDVINKPARNTSFDTALNEEARVLGFVYLLKIQSILQGCSAGFAKFILQRFIFNIRLLPLTIRYYCSVPRARYVEIKTLRMLLCGCRNTVGDPRRGRLVGLFHGMRGLPLSRRRFLQFCSSRCQYFITRSVPSPRRLWYRHLMCVFNKYLSASIEYCARDY